MVRLKTRGMQLNVWISGMGKTRGVIPTKQTMQNNGLMVFRNEARPYVHLPHHTIKGTIREYDTDQC